ncbi:hypothetical protein CARUB_v10001953mg [Capsella rubella]|uniref:CUE domain-containing protein n=1 Tax=Capsella rubella TaxID=81985 RepID=R0FB62_9BRAS|nr:polyadenylate-binding protein-interacting protein 6 [Capsella rubella]XP_023636260.1 polyadenylate-binding protein-interacting protein 6 [Capsella rubella]EOA19282.1 hypothetical protein CARUB_v10001953mg [Capsella rubella]
MKSGGSSTLNPYAAAYVPLSKRDASFGGGGAAAKPSAYHQVQHQQPHQVAHGYGVQGMGSYPSPPQMKMPTKKSPDMVYNHQMKEEDLEMDMDIEFLLVTFSGLSHESINDVYLANNCDLDATIEMLNQLEIYSTEAQEYLPDTLDIGDVPETITEPSKLKNETSASSSSSGIRNPYVSSS